MAQSRSSSLGDVRRLFQSLFLTLSELLDSAIHDKVIELQNAHNNGQPFPPRPGNLRGGRPLGS
jgi:hypothetical protein